MAGHSKRAQIKRERAVPDARRPQLWRWLRREIPIAPRVGGGAPTANSWLRTFNPEARAANVCDDEIERAILERAGALERKARGEVSYEGHRPSDVTILVEAMTGDHNPTAAHVRPRFDEHRSSFGTSGCGASTCGHRGSFVSAPTGPGVAQSSTRLPVARGALDLRAFDAVRHLGSSAVLRESVITAPGCR